MPPAPPTPAPPATLGPDPTRHDTIDLMIKVWILVFVAELAFSGVLFSILARRGARVRRMLAGT